LLPFVSACLFVSLQAEKPKPAPKVEEKAAAAAEPEEGAAGTADDPYAFMPKPEDNNQVRSCCASWQQ
jgi:hypothetical protein